MTPQEEKQISEWNAECAENIQLRLILTTDKRSAELHEFCDAFSRFAPKIQIVKEKEEWAELPAIQVGTGLRYHAVPSGTEIAPFLESLNMLANKSEQIPAHVQEYLDKIEMPAMLRMYVSAQCPFCPVALRQLTPLVSANDFIRLSVIDAFLFPETAQADNIQSVPTLLLDEHFRWTGSVQTEELLKIIITRNPADIGVESMAHMISEGNAFRLSDMMLEKETIFPAFVELLTHEQFSVRLGAMAAMEEIAAQNISLAGDIVEPLWAQFQKQNDQIRGDILHIIGESAGSDMLPRLKKISEGQYDADIRETAQEAIEKIEKREVKTS